MAQIANTVSTTVAIGNAEDVVNTIWNIDPHETPGLTLFEKTKAEATNHEWLTGSLAAAASNAQIEGNDADFSAAARPVEVRLGNRLQTSWKLVSVTGMQEFVRKYGRKSELAKELFKMGRELRTDIEKGVFDNNAKVTGNSSTAAEAAGIPAWLITNIEDGGGAAADPTGDGTDARTDGDAQALTEADLKTVFLGAWTNGGQPDWVICGGANKQRISTFDGIATKYQNAESGKIIAGVDYYESDFGMVKVIANRFSRARDVFLLQKDLWAIAFGRNMFVKKLAPTGDAEKRMLITDWTVEARSEQGNGLVTDATL